MTATKINELLARYKTGDIEAQDQLLMRLETLLRALVRSLVGKQIRNERESLDLCQSLLLSFHIQAKDGRLDIPNEKALTGYLRTMVRHKMANVSDHINRHKRGGGKQPLAIDAPLGGHDDDGPGIQLPAYDPSASMVAATAEARRNIEDCLTPDEQAILEARLSGNTNIEIAERLGKQPDAIRMTWNRARTKLIERGVFEG